MKLKYNIALIFVVSLIGFVFTVFIAHNNVEQIREENKWIHHTYEVLSELDSLLTAVNRAESSGRGYVISGNRRYYNDYRNQAETAGRCVDKIKQLTADNPRQQGRIEPLRALVNQRVTDISNLVDAREKGLAAIPNKFQEEANSLTVNQMRAVVAEMKTEEDSLLRERRVKGQGSIQATEQAIAISIGCLLLFILLAKAIMVTTMSRSFARLQEGTDKIAAGEFKHRIGLTTKDEFGALSKSFDSMAGHLESLSNKQTEKDWLKTNLNKFAGLLQGYTQLDKASEALLEELVPLLNAQHAAFYKINNDVDPPVLELKGTYACENADALPRRLALGEGLIGQSARDHKSIFLENVDAESFVVSSALTKGTPGQVLILPLLYEAEPNAVLEIATLGKFSDLHREFLEDFTVWLGVLVNTIGAISTTELLLDDARILNEEMQAQQEELEAQHEELEGQQEELRQLNEEMEQKSDQLIVQNQAFVQKNRDLETMQRAMQSKNNELQVMSKYKSEFLANMSHDLRTPLNSLLIFSELLQDNDEQNMQEHQLEYAKNINLAGKTLLSLVDDILDLSKIESGTVSVSVSEVPISGIEQSLKNTFEKTAINKGIEFTVAKDSDVPVTMQTDEKRLLQLLTNLVGNAVKFTQTGSVRVHISKVQETTPENPRLVFAVTDTGMGIPKEKHELVFEAFRQADSDIKSKYGGTGLGLAICKELAELLGGFIDLESAVGQGSTFTLVLPAVYTGTSKAIKAPADENGDRANHSGAPRKQPTRPPISRPRLDREIAGHKVDIQDDRKGIKEGDRILLIIEDDPSFATVLLGAARKEGFKGIVSMTGVDGLAIAKEIIPDAVTLDIGLPDVDGWVVLDQLKESPQTRHIPVHIISVEPQIRRGMELGAFGFLEKPVTLDTLNEAISRIRDFVQQTAKTGHVLLVQHNEELQRKLTELIESEDIKPTAVSTARDALDILAEQTFDCIVVDVRLPDDSGLELISQMQSLPNTSDVPIIIYTSSPLSDVEKSKLNELKKKAIVKNVETPGHLLSEIGLFLHRVEATLSEGKRRLLEKARLDDRKFAGRKILIVDDDPRNIGALKSMLGKYHMELLSAGDGEQAISLLEQYPDIDLVLMDMMMPVMDGYEAMRAIRTRDRYKDVPIIAVTAKAMVGDRRKCLEAGASDYLAKPVDRSRLLSLLRVWLYGS